MLTPGDAQIDRVLFRLGMAYALPKNPAHDPAQAIAYLNQLTNQFPASPWRPQAELLAGLELRANQQAQAGQKRIDAARHRTAGGERRLEHQRTDFAASMIACVVLLEKTAIATRSGALQWAVFIALIATPVILVVLQRARLRFDIPVAWGVVVWPLYIYATWVLMFIARRVDPAWWPLAPIGIAATACFGLVLLFLPNLALLRRRSA